MQKESVLVLVGVLIIALLTLAVIDFGSNSEWITGGVPKNIRHPPKAKKLPDPAKYPRAFCSFSDLLKQQREQRDTFLRGLDKEKKKINEQAAKDTKEAIATKQRSKEYITQMEKQGFPDVDLKRYDKYSENGYTFTIKSINERKDAALKNLENQKNELEKIIKTLKEQIKDMVKKSGVDETVLKNDCIKQGYKLN